MSSFMFDPSPGNRKRLIERLTQAFLEGAAQEREAGYRRVCKRLNIKYASEGSTPARAAMFVALGIALVQEQKEFRPPKRRGRKPSDRTKRMRFAQMFSEYKAKYPELTQAEFARAMNGVGIEHSSVAILEAEISRGLREYRELGIEPTADGWLPDIPATVRTTDRGKGLVKK